MLHTQAPGEDSLASLRSSQNSVNHASFNIGQAIVAACMAEGQPFVIQTEKMQDRGVKIVDMHAIGSATATPKSSDSHARCRL